MFYAVAILPTKDGQAVQYLGSWGRSKSHRRELAQEYTWERACQVRDELRRQPGLTPEGRESIVVVS